VSKYIVQIVVESDKGILEVLKAIELIIKPTLQKELKEIRISMADYED